MIIQLKTFNKILLSFNPKISHILIIAIYKKNYNSIDHPNYANTSYKIAQQYSKMGKYEQALEAFHNVLGKRVYFYREQRYGCK